MYGRDYGNDSTLPEAPKDGKKYGRKDASWAEVTGGTSSALHADLTDTDTDGHPANIVAVTLTATNYTAATQDVEAHLSGINTAIGNKLSNVSGSNHNDLQNKDAAGNHAKLVPSADGTTAIQITKADGSTAVVNIDTTNSRVTLNGNEQLSSTNYIYFPVAQNQDTIGDKRIKGDGTWERCTVANAALGGGTWISDTAPTALTTNKGSWNASTNTPALSSGVGTSGDWYTVSVAGTTSIDGIAVWGAGDYIWFDGSTNTYQKINNQVGSAAIGGINKNVQYNNAGVPGGSNSFNWDEATKRLSVNRTTASAPLHVEATASSANEIVQRWTVSDDGGAYLEVRNGLASTAANRFNPCLYGLATNTSDPCVTIWAGLPGQTGTTPALLFKADYNGSALTSRPIAAWRNHTTTVMTLDYTGYLGIGTISPSSLLHTASTSTSSPRGITSSQHNDGTNASRINMQKSRGTNASPTIVTTGDALGAIIFSGYDGANYKEMASIQVVATGTIGTDRVPTYLTFSTATNAAPSVLTVRMKIDEDGKVGIGTTVPKSALQVNGGIQCADDADVASADKVGTFRYRVSGNNSYVEVCVQTGASSYAWQTIITNSW